tara:strand:- start:12532 stop:12957 length:426 start_codon:yes stop_codon:yes gene_type:complete
MNGMILSIRMYKKKPMSGLRRFLTNHSRLANKFLSKEDLEETPLFFTLSTSGAGTLMGTDAYKIHHANRANKEFAEFATNQQKLIEWVNQESANTLKFYLRPGGLISRVTEDDRPTEEEVMSWVPIIEGMKVVGSCYPLEG